MDTSRLTDEERAILADAIMNFRRQTRAVLQRNPVLTEIFRLFGNDPHLPNDRELFFENDTCSIRCSVDEADTIAFAHITCAPGDQLGEQLADLLRANHIPFIRPSA